MLRCYFKQAVTQEGSDTNHLPFRLPVHFNFLLNASLKGTYIPSGPCIRELLRRHCQIWLKLWPFPKNW
ncbi:hypothetical protein KC19_3G200000 [Ceratodon purpureus]|uniref:Uncharacterized protein n=1 Tax=Ceratodon purpureus TaxID=3225 RepID=A0A8T0IN77_CERPU|nr:hypothetical protein KC19_3G200000 [Ceratodon purpureus]